MFTVVTDLHHSLPNLHHPRIFIYCWPYLRKAHGVFSPGNIGVVGSFIVGVGDSQLEEELGVFVCVCGGGGGICLQRTFVRRLAPIGLQTTEPVSFTYGRNYYSAATGLK